MYADLTFWGGSSSIWKPQRKEEKTHHYPHPLKLSAVEGFVGEHALDILFLQRKCDPEGQAMFEIYGLK